MVGSRPGTRPRWPIAFFILYTALLWVCSATQRTNCSLCDILYTVQTTLHCTKYTAQCKLHYTVQHTLHSTNYTTLYNVHCTIQTTLWTHWGKYILHLTNWAAQTLQCTGHTEDNTLKKHPAQHMHNTEQDILYMVWALQTAHCTSHAVHPMPSPNTHSTWFTDTVHLDLCRWRTVSSGSWVGPVSTSLSLEDTRSLLWT